MLNKDEVRILVENWIKKNLGASCRINPAVFNKTWESYQHDYPFTDDLFEEGLTNEDYVNETYEYYLFEMCEHEDYEIEEDEDRDGRSYRYAWCPFCGHTASISEAESEDGKEQIFEWE